MDSLLQGQSSLEVLKEKDKSYFEKEKKNFITISEILINKLTLNESDAKIIREIAITLDSLGDDLFNYNPNELAKKCNKPKSYIETYMNEEIINSYFKYKEKLLLETTIRKSLNKIAQNNDELSKKDLNAIKELSNALKKYENHYRSFQYIVSCVPLPNYEDSE